MTRGNNTRQDVHRHILVTVYERPWWNWFRKTFSLRCWKCDIVMWEHNPYRSQA
jgi:hypothetical protein